MRILTPLANGFEEMEAVILVDMLRRCGADVTTASITASREITGSRNITLLADALWQDLDLATFDALAIPGGLGGVTALRADGRAAALAKEFHAQGKRVAAICAAPLILLDAGLLEGRAFTCHPAVAEQFPASSRSSARVVEDRGIITATGPGATFAFALRVAARLLGEDVAQRAADAACVLPENNQ